MPATILLFDLGGVLVDLGDPAGDMSLDMGNDEFWKLWLASPLVQQFESGRLSLAGFAGGISAGFGVADAADFERRLRRWQLPMYDGTEPYLRSLAESNEIALLSNTNEIHWQNVLSQTDVFEFFSHLFLSFETGNTKPQAAAFLDVVEHFGCAPADIVFLDDNAINVAAARVSGLRAKQVRGYAELKRAVNAFCA